MHDFPVNCLRSPEVNFDFQIAGVDYYMSGNQRRQSGLKEKCDPFFQVQNILLWSIETIALEDVLRLTAKPNTKAAVEEAFKLVIAAEVDSH